MYVDKLNKFFYMKRDLLRDKFIISDLNFGDFILIHSGTLVEYILVEYNEFMVDRLMKLYLITKDEKLKDLYDFMSYCFDKSMTLDEVMKTF